MKKIISVFLLCWCAVTTSAGEDKRFPSVPAHMLKSSHRLVSSVKKKDSTITSHGSAVAVDLSRLGYNGNRLLLTAAHCAVENGKQQACLIEVFKDGKKTWIETKVIAYDEASDIALLYAEEDLPVVAQLADGDLMELGDALFAIGSPQGTPLSATLGYLAEKGIPSIDDPHAGWYQGSNAITHGNSGGPIFDANRGTIIGIVTAVMGSPEAPNITLFIPAPEINKFIKANAEKIEKFLKKVSK